MSASEDKGTKVKTGLLKGEKYSDEEPSLMWREQVEEAATGVIEKEAEHFLQIGVLFA